MSLSCSGETIVRIIRPYERLDVQTGRKKHIMSEGYHYMDSGLDWVYLRNGYNGYEVHKTPYGEGISIHAVDKLHQAIAKNILLSPTRMRGQDCGSCGSLLDISQKGLGIMLGQSRTTIARWEGEPNEPIADQAADRLLRLFYAKKMDSDALVSETINLRAEIYDLEHEARTFEEQQDTWRPAKAA